MRSRTPPTRRRPVSEPTYPIIPIAVAVVILGFVIGAAIHGLRRPSGAAVVSTTAASPVAIANAVTEAPTAPPTPIPTLAPTTVPTASPSPVPTRVTPRPTVTAAAHVTAKPVALPSMTPTPEPTPSPTPQPGHVQPISAVHPSVHRATPHPVAHVPVVAKTSAPIRTVAVAHTSTVAHTREVAQYTPPPPPPPTESSSDDALLVAARQAVRTYIQALVAGDESTASAQLLANAGSSASRLGERSILDASTRIVDMSARATSATTAIVDADIQTGNGLYYGHYEVRRLESGVTLITAHSFVKS